MIGLIGPPLLAADLLPVEAFGLDTGTVSAEGVNVLPGSTFAGVRKLEIALLSSVPEMPGLCCGVDIKPKPLVSATGCGVSASAVVGVLPLKNENPEGAIGGLSAVVALLSATASPLRSPPVVEVGAIERPMNRSVVSSLVSVWLFNLMLFGRTVVEVSTTAVAPSVCPEAECTARPPNIDDPPLLLSSTCPPVAGAFAVVSGPVLATGRLKNPPSNCSAGSTFFSLGGITGGRGAGAAAFFFPHPNILLA